MVANGQTEFFISSSTCHSPKVTTGPLQVKFNLKRYLKHVTAFQSTCHLALGGGVGVEGSSCGFSRKVSPSGGSRRTQHLVAGSPQPPVVLRQGTRPPIRHHPLSSPSPPLAHFPCLFNLLAARSHNDSKLYPASRTQVFGFGNLLVKRPRSSEESSQNKVLEVPRVAAQKIGS